MTQSSLAKIFGLVVLVALATPQFVQAGFGVSPASIIEDKAIPGATFTRVIYLVQGTPDVPATIEASIESRDIKDWITFNQGERFTIPAGVQQFPLPITITIPSDAPLGVYKAFVRVRTIPDPATQSGEVAVSLGGRVDVSITVGNNIVEAFAVKNIDILDVEEGAMPRVSVTIENTGNVPALPDSASFELFDKFGDIRLAYGRVSFDSFEKTPAFNERTYLVDFPFDVVLATGEYWGHTKIYTNDGTVIRELKTIFNVHPRGASLGNSVTSLFRSMTPVTALGVGLVALAIVVLLVLWILRRRNRQQPTPFV